MNCEKIRDLILTDYLDNQVNEKQRKDVEDHLAKCAACREFAVVAKKTVIEPFDNANQFHPPEFVWSRIKDVIQEEQESKSNVLAKIRERLESAFAMPIPVLARSTIVILIIVVGVLTQIIVRHTAVMKANSQEQVEYLASLSEEPREISLNEEQGFGSLIEKYFL